ncbi:Tripeptidyl-peptidase SED2 [Trametes pubescens]|uniref:Tripeptidyl-peptidase SED2 n=1 Tax=Trametes pubescens TaxID=154538 RepID=A0A1M2VBI3_TRAPU|nr:Tripeptidyl-peptidase SED2 [Trametes pubescens]
MSERDEQSAPGLASDASSSLLPARSDASPSVLRRLRLRHAFGCKGGSSASTSETAADFSSGGFSNVFTRPSYQSTAVSSYLTALGSTNSGKFNTFGCAFPDIATQGVDFEIVVGGRTEGVDGTSCASPKLAAIISLLNDRLIAAGKSPLGFLNPFLYSAVGTAALTDITSGSNPGCGTHGFPAIRPSASTQR